MRAPFCSYVGGRGSGLTHSENSRLCGLLFSVDLSLVVVEFRNCCVDYYDNSEAAGLFQQGPTSLALRAKQPARDSVSRICRALFSQNTYLVV